MTPTDTAVETDAIVVLRKLQRFFWHATFERPCHEDEAQDLSREIDDVLARTAQTHAK